MYQCKICFCEIKPRGINSLLKTCNICQKCFNEFNPKFIRFKISNINCLAIYEYDEQIKKLLYQFKGCFDYELKDIFIGRFKYELSIRYKGYYLLPAPSNKEDDEKRGFNHVIEMFSVLNLPYLDIIRKQQQFKQSSLSKEERAKIEDKLYIVDSKKIKYKKILIIDDVTTTGATVKAMINILSNYQPKDIKVLVLAKNCRIK